MQGIYSLPDKIGKYRIINEVGKGSTGTVYLSHDPYYGRDVAIKLYNAEISGDDKDKARNARKMFVEMTRSEGALLSACEAKSPDLPQMFATRVAWLQSNFSGGIVDPRLVTPPTLAALLLLGSDKSVKADSQSVSRMYQLLSHQVTMQLITPQDERSILGTLLNQWVASVSNGSNYGMMLALKYNLKETGLKQARKFLEQKTRSTSTAVTKGT